MHVERSRTPHYLAKRLMRLKESLQKLIWIAFRTGDNLRRSLELSACRSIHALDKPPAKQTRCDYLCRLLVSARTCCDRILESVSINGIYSRQMLKALANAPGTGGGLPIALFDGKPFHQLLGFFFSGIQRRKHRIQSCCEFGHSRTCESTKYCLKYRLLGGRDFVHDGLSGCARICCCKNRPANN